MNESNKKIKNGAIISYLAIFISIASALIYLPWMTREMGQSNYGLYTLANSFVTMFLVDFGLSSAVSRFLAKYRAERNQKKEDAVFSIVTRLYLAIDTAILLILVIAFFVLELIYKGLTSDEIATLRILYVIVGIFSIISFPSMPLDGVMIAHEEFAELKICDLGQKLFAIALIVIALINHLGVVAVVTANAASSLLFIVAKIIIIRKKKDIHLDMRVIDKELSQDILSFSVWTAISGFCQRFYFSFAPTILGIVSDSHEIALFAPANALEGYFYMFAAAVNGLFLAKISRYIAEDQEDRIYKLMIKVGRYQLFVMGLIFVGYICIGREFMVQWMGTDYEKAYYCGLFLFVPDFLGFTQQIGNTAIVAKNKVKPSAIGYIMATVTCVMLSFIISRQLGALGASIAIAVGYMIAVINVNRIMHFDLGISIPGFFKECFGSFVIPQLITLVVGYFGINRVSISGWAGIGIKAMLVVALYFALTIGFALNKEEKSMIRKLIKKEPRHAE